MEPGEAGDAFGGRAQAQVIRVAEDHLRPAARRSPGVNAFTVAWVPTGMNWGVSIVPWAVVIRPRRARPTMVGSNVNDGACAVTSEMPSSRSSATVAGYGSVCWGLVGL